MILSDEDRGLTPEQLKLRHKYVQGILTARDFFEPGHARKAVIYQVESLDAAVTDMIAQGDVDFPWLLERRAYLEAWRLVLGELVVQKSELPFVDRQIERLLRIIRYLRLFQDALATIQDRQEPDSDEAELPDAVAADEDAHQQVRPPGEWRPTEDAYLDGEGPTEIWLPGGLHPSELLSFDPTDPDYPLVISGGLRIPKRAQEVKR